MIIGNRAVCKTVELRKLCNIIPDLLIIGMENMCTILMNIDSLNLLCVHVSCNIRAFVNHENRFARLLRLMSKDSTVKTGSYDKKEASGDMKHVLNEMVGFGYEKIAEHEYNGDVIVIYAKRK